MPWILYKILKIPFSFQYQPRTFLLKVFNFFANYNRILLLPSNFLILKVWTAVERSSMEYRWKGSSHFSDQEEAALEADFLVIYCWGVWVQITMPIHYSELQKGKTKHVSPVSPCPSSEVHRRAGREASTGGRIHTLSFQTIPARSPTLRC